MKYFQLLGLSLLFCLNCQAQTVETEKAAVIGTVQALFDAMAAKDSLTARSLFLPNSQSYIGLQGNDSSKIIVWDNENIIKQMRLPQTEVRERMWQVDVKVQGRIAQLWANYDLYVNGKFRHCGVDAFLLVKEKEGWKIASGAFTIETAGCQPPPSQD